jgi:hypothetical protein
VRVLLQPRRRQHIRNGGVLVETAEDVEVPEAVRGVSVMRKGGRRVGGKGQLTKSQRRKDGNAPHRTLEVSSGSKARVGRVDRDAADCAGGKGERGKSARRKEQEKEKGNAPLCPSICHLFASSFGVLKSRKMRPPSLSEAARRKEWNKRGEEDEEGQWPSDRGQEEGYAPQSSLPVESKSKA